MGSEERSDINTGREVPASEHSKGVLFSNPDAFENPDVTSASESTSDDLPCGVRLLHVVPADEYPPAGGAFVWNGAGLGKLCWLPCSTDDPYGTLDSFLMLGDVPLLQWQMKNQCPTCEQLLQAGDTPGHELEQFATAINHLTNETALADCLKSLTPVIHLLSVGLYFISFDDYSPTNGEGRFFWRAFGELYPCESMRERNDYENPSLQANGNFPAFLAPTQSTAKFDQARFDSARLSFREQPGLALYLHGRLSALLDGHHRATCAAMHSERFRALTIANARLERKDGNVFLKASNVSVSMKNVAQPNQMWLDDSSSSRSRSARQCKTLDVDAYHAKLQRVVWPELPKWVTTVIQPANYWNNEQLDAIARFSQRGVPISQQFIEETLAGSNEKAGDLWMLEELLKALALTNDPQAIGTGMRVVQSPRWSLLWEKAYRLLAKYRNEEVENQFVEFLVNDDGGRPEIKAIVDRYFEARD